MDAGKQLNLTWRPRPHQVIPSSPEAVTIVAIAGRGTGKTWNGTRWLLTQALIYPRTTWMAVGQTWRDAQRILAEGEGGLRWHILGDPDKGRPNLEAVCRGGAWHKGFVRTPGQMTLYLANGSEIRFASADIPDSLRGTNAHGALADELAFWDRASFDMLRLAVRLPLPDGGPARIFAATTPNGMSWFYDRFLNPERLPRPDVVFVGGAGDGHLPPDPPPSTFDNPHTDPVWRRQLLAMYEGTDLARQEIYGQIVSAAGAVFKNFSTLRHTRAGIEASGHAWPTPADCDEVIAGQDLGAENPSSLIVLARKGDRWHAVAEVYAPAETETAWHNAIRRTLDEWRPARIYSDRNFPQTTNSQRARGLPIVLADKGPDSVVDGIRAVQTILTSDRLAIDPEACPNLLRELRNYRWQTKSDGSPMVPERPVKKDDHAVDAVRYAIYMAEEKPRRKLLIAG
jgi:phage terminase large subunit-like protein